MDMQKETLAGRVEALVYTSEQTGYAVLRVKTEQGTLVTAVGFLPFAAAGEMIEAEGEWINHPRHGLQFKARSFQTTQPADEAAMQEYLEVLPGIGRAMAARIVDRFGADTLDIMAQNPERLSEVSGITRERARKIGQDFRHVGGVRRLMQFLLDYNLPPQLALRLSREYGEGAVEAVRQNPYLLLDEQFEVPFSLCDQMALSLGIEAEDVRRVEAAVLHVLAQNLDGGHAYLPQETLVATVEGLVGVEPELVAEAIDSLWDQKNVMVESVGRHTACYLSSLYEAERVVAEGLLAMTEPLPKPKGFAKLMQAVARTGGVDYAPAQKEAMETAAQHRLFLLTGGPGTGKTTTLRGILSLFEAMGLSCLLAAPTGRAAKRMEELTGREAKTIHRMLEMQPDDTGRFVFGRDEDNPLEADAVIIDEMSMVDVLLMHALVSALPKAARLVMVGDPDQLPPVGPGQVLTDLLGSGRVRTVRLTDIFRQAEQSRIVLRAHEVNAGRSDGLRENTGDFFFMRRNTAETTLSTVLELVTKRLPDKMGVPSAQIQVLSPTRKGVAGTVNLNRHLQQALNPPSPEKKQKQFGEVLFREGDRVMQIKNNYDLPWREEKGSGQGQGVYNGDIGLIVSIDDKRERLLISFDDRMVDYPFDLLYELELSYAVTVHKSQGSEYPAVVMAVCSASPMLLSRRVLYTAITRARSLMVIVGQEEALLHMVENKRSFGRFSGLKLRLRQP